MLDWPAPRDPILVVDADAGIREFVAVALAEIGYPAMTAADGRAALAIVQRVLPSVILLDTLMPQLDGWSFLRCYRQLPPPHAPVIIFATDTDAATHALQAGATTFLAKPCSLDDLYDVILRTAEDGARLPRQVALEHSRRVAVLAWDAAGPASWLVASS